MTNRVCRSEGCLNPVTGNSRRRYCTDQCQEKDNTRRKQARRRATYTHKRADKNGRGLDPKTIKKLDAVRAILSPDNPLTVRSCCYHLLQVCGLLDSTDQFGNMGSLITAARIREAGDNSLPDDCFVDHRRELIHPSSYADLSEFKQYVKYWYRRDYWQDQQCVPMILCEKRGFGDILKKITEAAGVRLFLSSGHIGRSIVVQMAKEIAAELGNDKLAHRLLR